MAEGTGGIPVIGLAASVPAELYLKRSLDGMSRERRLVLLLALIAIGLKLSEIKFAKWEIGGSEVIIPHPYVVTGTIGLFILYLVVSLVRRFFGAVVWEKVLGAIGPETHPHLKAAGSIWMILELFVFAIEGILVSSAIGLCWDDVVTLASNIWKTF